MYPATGTDLRRPYLDGGSWYRDDVMFARPTLAARVQCIREIVRGLSALHRLGVVHGDMHAGNVGLPLPSRPILERVLARPLLEHPIVRGDGQPTSPRLPTRVAEPVNIGYSVGPVTILSTLFRRDPAERLAVTDLERDAWLVSEAAIEAANGEPETREPWEDDPEEVAAYWAPWWILMSRIVFFDQAGRLGTTR